MDSHRYGLACCWYTTCVPANASAVSSVHDATFNACSCHLHGLLLLILRLLSCQQAWASKTTDIWGHAAHGSHAPIGAQQDVGSITTLKAP